MKLNELKNLIEIGAATEIEISHYGGSSTVGVKSGDSVSVLETARGNLRRFKTLDAAFEVCQELQDCNPFLDDKLPIRIVTF